MQIAGVESFYKAAHLWHIGSPQTRPEVRGRVQTLLIKPGPTVMPSAHLCPPPSPPQCCIFSSIQVKRAACHLSDRVCAYGGIISGGSVAAGRPGTLRRGFEVSARHDGGVQEVAEGFGSPVGLVYSGHIRPGIGALRFLRFFSLLLFKIWIRQNSSRNPVKLPSAVITAV